MLALLPAVPNTFRQIGSWLQPRKTPALIALGAALVLGWAALLGSKMTAQAPLFDEPLHPAQTSEVERALLLWNVPFTTDTVHSQIYVNGSHRRDVLLRLAMANLPHPYVPTSADVMGEQLSAFAPQSEIDDRRRAGIEGDLVAGLRRWQGVADASVVIAPAADNPLAVDDGRTPASASVQLLMQAGATLTATQITGIQRYVAAAYPGLTAEHVVVADAAGNDRAAAGGPEGLAARQSGLQNSIQSALDEVFGVGATVVRVSMRAADEERTSQSTIVTPHGLLEAERGSENGSESGKRFTRERTHTRYAYDTVVQTSTAHAGALALLSVAVFMDSQRVSRAQSRLITDVVRAAAGAQLGNDQVVVAALPFRSPRSTARPASFLQRHRWAALAVLASTFAGAVSLAVWVRRRPALSDDERAAHTVAATLQNEMPQTAAYVLGSLPRSVRARVLQAYAPQQRERIVAYMNGRARS
jgi:flagellar biosynthesis/type III secretory pathway M-ring protein FliF/YscJ